MTDMRRTLPWGVFLISLFLLYDAWNKHTGRPSMFAPPPATFGESMAKTHSPTASAPRIMSTFVARTRPIR